MSEIPIENIGSQVGKLQSNTDKVICLIAVGLVIGTLFFPMDTTDRYSTQTSNAVVGILFLPSAIAARSFCDQSIVEPSAVESIPLSFLNVSTVSSRAQEIDSNLVSTSDSTLNFK